MPKKNDTGQNKSIGEDVGEDVGVDAKKPVAKKAAKKPVAKKAAKKPVAKKKTNNNKKRKHNSARAIEEYHQETQRKIREGLDIGGRPSKYSRELALEILERIARGESVNRICKDKHMPEKFTVFGWAMFPHMFPVASFGIEEFEWYSTNYKYARQLQAEGMLDETSDIADDSRNDFIEKLSRNGEKYISQDQEFVNRSKLRIETRKWLSSIYLSKVKCLQDKNINVQSGIDAEGKPKPLMIRAYDDNDNNE